MRARRSNFILKNPLKVLVLLSVFLIVATCSSEQLWQQRNNGKSAVKSDDITKAKNVFVDLAKELNPAVVNIFTTHTIKQQAGLYEFDMFRMLEEMMGGRGGMPRQYTPRKPITRKATALGSGFLINKDGHIITNNHVIDGADKISVKLYNGIEYEAKVVGVDPETDIALIKINAKKTLPFAYLGDSSKSDVGEWVVAIGNPVGQSNTVTAGIISAKGRIVPDVNVYSDFIQTDAAINPGNSGGPLVNINGEVIGVNTAINRRMGAVPIEGIGFAIPIDNIKKILPQLAKGEKISHQQGWLGITMSGIDEAIIESLGVKNVERGVIVTEVLKDSPAEKAGLKPYDIITAFDGKPVSDPAEFSVMVRRAAPNKTYVVDLIRNKSNIKVNVKLSDRKNVDEDVIAPLEGKQKEKKEKLESSMGMSVEDITNESVQRYGLRDVKPGEGVVVTDVDFNSGAAMAGIVAGDVIVELNRKPVKNANTFYKEIKEKSGNLFKIKRGNATIIIGINLRG
jgi:Do/DeqQ family serine protease